MSNEIAEKFRGVSISHGTMLVEDLIPEFESALSILDPERLKELRAELAKDPGDESEALSYHLDDLFSALDESAPAGCYFGAHMGDGCDYGFWENEGYYAEIEGPGAMYV